MGLFLGNKVKFLLLILLLGFIKCPAQIAKWPIYTLNNKLWVGNDTGSYFVILKNNKTCFNCYAELNKYLDSINCKCAIYCITQADSSVFSRKLQYSEVKKLMPNVTEVLFDYEKLNEGFGLTEGINKNSIFYQYKIDITPALLRVKKGKIYYYSYQDIFSSGGINLNLKD